jgi:hypothetical protein
MGEDSLRVSCNTKDQKKGLGIFFLVFDFTIYRAIPCLHSHVIIIAIMSYFAIMRYFASDGLILKKSLFFAKLKFELRPSNRKSVYYDSEKHEF